MIRVPVKYFRFSRLAIESGISLSQVQSIQMLHGARQRKSSFYFSPLLDSDSFIEFENQLPGYSAKLKKNRVVRKMARSESRKTLKKVDIKRTVNPTNNLLVISDNWNFLQSAIEGMEDQYGINVRTFDYSLLRKSKYYNFNSTILGTSKLYYASKLARKAIDDTLMLRELLDSCDSILVEWGSDAARFFSHHLDDKKRLIVRVHSYEAFTPLSYFINFSRIDQLIFVAPHIRNLMDILHEGRIKDIEKTVIPNVRKLEYATKKSSGKKVFTIGMAGYSNQNKNPIMALQIVKALRDNGRIFQLRFCGSPWPVAGLKQNEKVYRDSFYSYLKENELDHLVIFDPYVDEMAEWFREVDFILSCSFREGTHEVIVEGAAFGCIPLIRDWPMVKSLGGARAVFSDFEDYVFENVDEAALLINGVLNDFDRISNFASEITKKNFGLNSTLPQFVEKCLPDRAQDLNRED